MKELLEQLGFKDDNGVYLPTRTEFDDALEGFVDDISFTGGDYYFRRYSTEYRRLVKQLLALWMFMPCDDNGEVLEKPKITIQLFGFEEAFPNPNYSKELKQYKQAEARVLFKGWKQRDSEHLDNGLFEFDLCGGWRCYKGLDNENYIVVSQSTNTIEQAINNGVKLYLK